VCGTAVVRGRGFVAGVQVKWMWLADVVVRMCEVLGLRPLPMSTAVDQVVLGIQ
jgi:hypothetical protein